MRIRRRIDKAGHLIYPDGQNRGRGSGEADRGQYDRFGETLWPDGCAAMYRQEMLAEIGGFDEDLFAYADDAELGLRARGGQASRSAYQVAAERVPANSRRLRGQQCGAGKRHRLARCSATHARDCHETGVGIAAKEEGGTIVVTYEGAARCLSLLAPALCAADARPLFNGKDLRDGRGFRVTKARRPINSRASWSRTACWSRSRTRRRTTSGTPARRSATPRCASSIRCRRPAANSGVFIRIPVQPKSEDDAINKGIEVQIDERGDEWHCTGVLYSMTQAKARPYKPAGEWNTLEITMKGPRTIVKLNGVLVTDYDGVSPVPPKNGQLRTGARSASRHRVHRRSSTTAAPRPCGSKRSR